MIILGIDPGASGGWALFSTDEDTGANALFGYGRMPKRAYGKKQMADGDALYTAIGQSANVAVIEHVHAMPAQGVASSFMFGLNTGVTHGVAHALSGEVVTVTPQKWKKHFGLTSDKRASLAHCAERFPFANVDWGVLANDGIAEAALMALWYAETSREDQL